MAKKEMTIRATPQNELLGAVSRGLGSLRSRLGGVGDFLIGKAPEEVENWSYGFSPFKENPSASSVPIEVRPGREEGLIDTLGLPVAEAYGLGKLAGKGVSKAAEKAISGATQQGRREFLKKAGQAAAGTAAVATTPDLVKAVGKKAGPAIAKAASPDEFVNAMKDISHDANRAAFKMINSLPPKDYGGYGPGKLISMDDMKKRYQSFKDLHKDLYDQFKTEAYKDLQKDPKFAPWKDYINHEGLDKYYQHREDILTGGEDYVKYGTGLSENQVNLILGKRDYKSGGSVENTTHDRKMI